MAVQTLKILTHAGHRLVSYDLDEAYDNEKFIIDHARHGKWCDADVAQAMVRIVREGDTVIDVGANIGYFTVLLGTLAGPSGTIVGVEPGAHNLARLRANLALNGLDRVTLVERPVTDRPGEVTFFINSDNSGGNALWDPAQFPGNVRSQAEPKPLVLSATTLDEEVRRLGLAPPRLVKIDTEGAEQRVLEGARGLLDGRHVPFIIVELHEFGLSRMGCSQASLRGFMEGFGYSTFLLNHEGSLPKLIPPGTELRSRYLTNILFSTPEAVGPCWPVEWYEPRG